MTPILLFALLAALLIAAAAIFLLPPLWRGVPPAAGAADRRAANLAIFRDQQAELAREKAEGALADKDFEEARQELSRRLLEEVEPAPGTPAGLQSASHHPSRPLAVALLVLLPLLAAGGYVLLGQPRALDPAQSAPAPKFTAAQIEGMVAKLAERMKTNPDDLQGWVMLGRSYKALGRPADAAAAYGKAESLVAGDASLLTDYAEVLAQSGNTGLQGKPRDLVHQALKLEPDHPNALLLAGAAAMEAGNRKEAIIHWEKLLLQLEPGSEPETLLRESLAKLKQEK